MTTGFSPSAMPDSLDLSAILDDSRVAEDGWAQWLGEDEAKRKMANAATSRPTSSPIMGALADDAR